MKKLLLVLFVVCGINQAFALEENSSSDCASLNSSTADTVVVSPGNVEASDEVESGAAGSEM